MTSKTKPGHPSIGRTPKRVVILGLPPVDGLDVIGPAEVFSLANNLHEGASAPYVLELVCAGVDPQMASSTGIGLMAHTTLEHERHADKSIDTLIVATGWQAIDQLDGAAIELAAFTTFGSAAAATDWWLGPELHSPRRMPAEEFVAHMTTIMLGAIYGTCELLGIKIDPELPVHEGVQRREPVA